MTYLIHRGEPAPDAVRRIIREQNRKVLALLADWRTDPVDRIHRARQACKRLRALLRLVRPAARYVYEVENRFYRDIQRRVSYARDGAAMVEALELIAADVGEPRLKESVELLRTALAARALAEVDESRSRLADSVAKACRELESADRRIRVMPLQDLRRRDLRRGAGRTLRRCAAGLAVVRDQDQPGASHEWRKHVKYAANQDRLLAEIGPVWTPAEGAMLGELGDVLGQFQDLVLLEALFRAQPDTLRIDTHVQRLRQLVARRQADLRGRALVLGNVLFADHAHALSRPDEAGSPP